MIVYLIEPYFTGSHQVWAEGYSRWSRHQVHLLTLPGRFWRWRMRGGAVTLSEYLRKAFTTKKPDLLLISDMVDVATLLSLTRDLLHNIPIVLYFHENQLTYPLPPERKRDIHYAWINYVSSLVCDKVLFNSHSHLNDWYSKLPDFLNRFPDFSQLDRIDELRNRSGVLYLGIDLSRLDEPAQYPDIPPRGTPGIPPLILWNQRWEYDKAPEQFFEILKQLDKKGDRFRLALAGKSFGDEPAIFLEAREYFKDRIVHFGEAHGEIYHALLQRSDIVLSTAIHETFGIAIAEAIYAGCFPLLPNRLSYPELLPAEWHGSLLYNQIEDAVQHLHAWLSGHLPRDNKGQLREYITQFNWPQMVTVYDDTFEQLVQRRMIR